MDDAIKLDAHIKKLHEAERLIDDEQADLTARVEAAVWVLDQTRGQDGGERQ